MHEAFRRVPGAGKLSMQIRAFTVGPPITTSFHHNVDKMPWECNSCFYQLAHGKIGFGYMSSFLKLRNLSIEDLK